MLDKVISMQATAGLIGLIKPRPSIRGFRVAERLFREVKSDCFRVFERSSGVEKRLYLARNRRSSAAELASELHELSVSVQALLLRNGQVGFIEELSSHTQQVRVHEKALAKGALSKPIRVALATALASALALVGFLIGAPTREQGVVSGGNVSDLVPKSGINSLEPPVPKSCGEILVTVDQEILRFFDDGSAVPESGVTLEKIETLRIGGFESVEVRASCKSVGQGSDTANTSQLWRVTLFLSDQTWKVKKMTRLDN